MVFASDSTVLLRIRPSLPSEDETTGKRGPLMMEPVVATMHALSGTDKNVSLELGMHEGKIAFYVRASKKGAAIIESQLYAHYPDADIEEVPVDLFAPSQKECVVATDLHLTDPEVFPIKRHPQFDDLLSRQNIDSIAGITSTLVRYPHPAMRGHIQVTFVPMGGKYRRRALKFLPLLTSGLSKHLPWYQKLFAKVHLADGLLWYVLLPLNILMGGFRAWFSFIPKSNVSLMTGDELESHDPDISRAISARSHDKEDQLSAAVAKVNQLLFRTNIRVSVITPRESIDDAKGKVEEIASSFRQFTLPDCNGLTMSGISEFEGLPLGFRRTPFALSEEEIATLWHLPNILVKTPNLDWVVSKKLEPPVNLPLEEGLTTLGESVFRGHRMKFGIRPDDRRRHMYIIGKTGMGKSTLLQNMIHSDVHAGKGLALIDPHGDLVESVLRYIPKHRTNDVILFDPADRNHPLSFNMLYCTNPDQYPLVASGMMSVFKKLWPDVWSGRMEHILRNTLLALIEAGGNSMLGIMRMFTDDVFRAKLLEHVNDHLVKGFWTGEYASWSEKYRTEAIAAIQNKIGQLLSNPMLRNIIGQVTSTVDIRHAMDSGKIILCNLSKGNLGEDESAFLGSMLVTKFQLDAMSRADISEHDRKDFYLYVDEFQNFATESFATILSEARKYRLNLTMANQYVGQLLIDNSNTTLKDAIFGNVGSMVSFQIGSDDAEELAMQFEEMVLPKDILSLPKYHAYMRLMIDGVPSKPFSVSTLAPPKPEEDEKRVQVIRTLSRERYTEKRSVVEEKLGKWISSAEDSRVSLKKAEKSKEKEAEEREKARKKGMKLDEYRAWRDREMWLNDYNMIRKKVFLEEPVTDDEKKTMAELEKKLETSGGVPEVSKTILDLKAKKEKKGI
jgi:hypothetical protein